MILNKETIDSLFDKSFSIDFIELTLTQLAVEEPIIYSGPGTIYMNSSGVLRLKMFHAFKDVKKEAFPRGDQPSPGRILEDQYYFELKGIDMKGDTWIAKKIKVSTGFSWPATGKVIETSLREIVNQSERPSGSNREKSYIFMAAAGQFDLPCNEVEKTESGGWSRNTSKFETDSLCFEAKSKNNSMLININGPAGTLAESTYEVLLEALSIIFGKFVLPSCISVTHGDTQKIKVISVSEKFPNAKITEPIKHSFPHEIIPFEEFITQYLAAYQEPKSEMFGYWHKINRAWQGGVENAALAITVSIEGITKNYFIEHGLPDSDFVKQAEEAKPKIKGLEIGQRIKDRLLSSLGQSKASNPKSALFNLAEQGLFPKKLVQDWASLRNMSAHSDNLDEDALQTYIDYIFSSLSLFYRLLFLSINYRNKFVDFTSEGWPEKYFGKEPALNQAVKLPLLGPQINRAFR